MDRLAGLLNLLPKVDQVTEKYAAAGEASLAGLDDLVPKSIVGAPLERPSGLAELPPARPELDDETRAAGGRALLKVQEEGPAASLDRAEMIGLEAIIALEGRPAILIQNGHFFPPPDGWQVLEDQRQAIETNLRSVGRIELTGHPSYEWVGTGFLVADDVIMTNRHVAEVFSRMNSRGKWSFISGVTSRIDYVEELGATTSSEFNITEIIGVHSRYDMALFRVEHSSATGQAAPTPLTVASRAPGRLRRRQVYTVGYPAWDGRRNDPVPMRRIFSDIFDVKRLQPGEISRVEVTRLFIHDCSTLGGNSGSCVIDLGTHQVLGLHFGGRYLEGNSAVALFRLTRDSLLRRAGVNFA